MLVRRDALRSAGFFDERFFLYSEETDLCFRIKQAGWEIRHLPAPHHLAFWEGWVESSSRCPGRLREAAVLRQAFLTCASTDGDRCARARVFGSRGTREREHGPETELLRCIDHTARFSTPALRCSAAGGGRTRSGGLDLSVATRANETRRSGSLLAQVRPSNVRG
jgi:Glycosyl transferase family group 2